jgi:hypothetical protein
VTINTPLYLATMAVCLFSFRYRWASSNVPCSLSTQTVTALTRRYYSARGSYWLTNSVYQPGKRSSTHRRSVGTYAISQRIVSSQPFPSSGSCIRADIHLRSLRKISYCQLASMSSSSTNTSQQNTSPTWLQHVKDHYAALASVPVYIDASISSGLLENALGKL